MNTKKDNKNCDTTIFYDGDCPVCAREINWIEKKSRKIKYTDITKCDLRKTGKSKDELMSQLHAQLENGEWIFGMEVVRKMYEDAGLGFLMKPTKWPILKIIFDFAYKIFAKYRVSLFQSKK